MDNAKIPQAFTADKNNSLTEADLTAFARLGILPDLLAQAGVCRVTNSEARENYGIRGDGDMSGVVFPYRGPRSGNRITARLRRDHPDVVNGKTERKYVCPYGDRHVLYFPPGAPELLTDPSVPIVLVEAEKSALAMTAWAARRSRRMVTAALGGCWGWRAKTGITSDAGGNRVEERGPAPGLEYASNGRKVFILLDANAATNEDVRYSRAKLIKQLKSQGADVTVLDLPIIRGMNGPDDLIMLRGDDGLEHVFTGNAGFDLVKLGDLLAEPAEAVEWCVDEMLPAGGLSLLVAKPKVGKSTLARSLALCVARGTPFLGRSVTRGSVIYLALEEKRSQVRQHFHDMGAIGDEEIFIHAAHAPAAALTALKKLADEKKPSLIIVDPLQKMLRAKDMNDYAEITTALEPFLIVARETGAHVEVVHHSGKMDRVDSTDAILGSTGLFGGVDVAIILKKLEYYRTVITVGRYGIDLEEAVLTLDSQSRTPVLGSSRKDAEEDRLSDLIFNQITDKPQTADAIFAEVEGRKQTKFAALKKLVKSGQVSQTGTGKRKDPYMVFRANPQNAPLYTNSGTESDSEGGEVSNTDPMESDLVGGNEKLGSIQFPKVCTKGGNQIGTETNPLKNQPEDSVPGTLPKNENGNQMAESREPNREPHFVLTPEPKGVTVERFKAIMGLDEPVHLTPEQEALERKSRPPSGMTKEEWKAYLHRTATDWTGKRLH